MQLLFVSILLVLSPLFSTIQTCLDLTYEINIVHTLNSLDNGKIEVTIKESSSEVKAYLYGDRKSKNRLNVDIDKLNNLKSGTYILVLQNKKCSTVKRDIIIK